MAFQIWQNCKLYLGGYNLSGDMNELALQTERAEKDVTAFGDATEHSVPGLFKNTVTAKGYYQADDVNKKVDDVLWSKFAVQDEVLSLCPVSGLAGEVAYLTKVLEAQYSYDGKVGEVFAFSVSANGTSDFIRTTVMESGAKSSTGNGTARNLGAVGANQKLYAAMHVLAVSGTTPTLDVVIESDDALGFASPITRATFTQVNAVGAQFLTPVAGPITDAWWRPKWTIGGSGSPSFIVVILLGIQ